VEKLLEDAQIKLSVVASDIFGVSGREMMAALIAGERDPRVLAQLARGRMRGKLGELREAFTGFFTDHHAMLLAKMLSRIDGLSADIADLEAAIEEMVAPFAQTLRRLDDIPGLGHTAAAVVVAEIGLDMTRFPTAAHLASWAKFAPGVKESAGKKKGKGSTGHGNRYLAKVLGEAAVATGRTDTFLGERYRRLARRRGKKKAIVAVGRSILVVICICCPTPIRRSSTSARTSTPAAPTPNAASEPISSTSKPSATRSPSNPSRPEPRPSSPGLRPGMTTAPSRWFRSPVPD
jgi:hypothetical protein